MYTHFYTSVKSLKSVSYTLIHLYMWRDVSHLYTFTPLHVCEEMWGYNGMLNLLYTSLLLQTLHVYIHHTHTTRLHTPHTRLLCYMSAGFFGSCLIRQTCDNRVVCTHIHWYTDTNNSLLKTFTWGAADSRRLHEEPLTQDVYMRSRWLKTFTRGAADSRRLHE